jgi:hypothetical protein
MGECEIALLDRENSESEKRVFDLPAVATQVGCGGRDKDLGVLGHTSLLPEAPRGMRAEELSRNLPVRRILIKHEGAVSSAQLSRYSPSQARGWGREPT